MYFPTNKLFVLIGEKNKLKTRNNVCCIYLNYGFRTIYVINIILSMLKYQQIVTIKSILKIHK